MGGCDGRDAVNALRAVMREGSCQTPLLCTGSTWQEYTTDLPPA
jgi:hypothetical protein